jgi:hypothetical protein
MLKGRPAAGEYDAEQRDYAHENGRERGNLVCQRHADSSPSTAIFFENVVMNAVDSAPSANKSRSKFGNRNAIKNASRFFLRRRDQQTPSRESAEQRLDRIARPTIPAARVLPRRSPTAVIGEQRTASDDLGKQKLY